MGPKSRVKPLLAALAVVLLGSGVFLFLQKGDDTEAPTAVAGTTVTKPNTDEATPTTVAPAPTAVATTLAPSTASTLTPTQQRELCHVAVVGQVEATPDTGDPLDTCTTDDFVAAVEAFGGTSSYIMFRTVLPNAWSPILVQCVVLSSVAILLEAALSFLGVGIPPPTPSWGNMIAGGRDLVPELRPTGVLDFDIMPMPVVDDAATVGDLTGICISSESSNVSEAADFLVDFISTESVSAVAAAGYLAPANTSVALSDAFLQVGRAPVHSGVSNNSIKSIRIPPLLSNSAELEAAVALPLKELLEVEVPDLDLLTEQIDEASQTVLAPPEETESSSPDDDGSD